MGKKKERGVCAVHVMSPDSIGIGVSGSEPNTDTRIIPAVDRLMYVSHSFDRSSHAPPPVGLSP